MLLLVTIDFAAVRMAVYSVLAKGDTSAVCLSV